MQDDLTPEIENNGAPDVSQETNSSIVENAAPEVSQAPEVEEPEKKKTGAEKRIDQLTYEKYEEQRQRKALEERLKELESKVEQPKPVVAPREEDFDDYNEYQEKQADYLAHLAAQKLQARQQQDTQLAEQRALEEKAAERTQKFVERVNSESSQYEGFQEKVNDPTFNAITKQMDPDLIALIQESDKGTALTYHLATNIAEADRISRLSPVLAARELSLIEASIQLPQPKKISDAPDPVKPIGGNESAVKNPDDMSMDEWMAWRNKQVRG